METTMYLAIARQAVLRREMDAVANNLANAGTTGYNADVDLRYLWMRQKRLQGSHFANTEQSAEFNRMVDSGAIDPALSRTFPLAEIGEALGMMDFETAAKVSGARFVFLKGQLARLEREVAALRAFRDAVENAAFVAAREAA